MPLFLIHLEALEVMGGGHAPDLARATWRPGSARRVVVSDVVGEQKSGSGRVRGRHFGVGVEVGFLTSGFFGFGYFPLGESGFGVFKFL